MLTKDEELLYKEYYYCKRLHLLEFLEKWMNGNFENEKRDNEKNNLEIKR